MSRGRRNSLGIAYVFVSHSWAHSDHYETIAGWLFEPPVVFNGALVHFINRSIPKDDPIHNAGSTEELRAAIFWQISQSLVVVVPTGMYTQCSRWIREEIAGARAHRKPILAVKPQGQKKRALRVEDAANEIVSWNGQSVVDSVWKMSVRGY